MAKGATRPFQRVGDSVGKSRRTPRAPHSAVTARQVLHLLTCITGIWRLVCLPSHELASTFQSFQALDVLSPFFEKSQCIREEKMPKAVCRPTRPRKTFLGLVLDEVVGWLTDPPTSQPPTEAEGHGALLVTRSSERVCSGAHRSEGHGPRAVRSGFSLNCAAEVGQRPTTTSEGREWGCILPPYHIGADRPCRPQYGPSTR